MLQVILPEFRADVPDDRQREEITRRVAEALQPPRSPREDEGRQPDEANIEFDAAMPWYDRELLRANEFEKLSAKDGRRAKTATSGSWMAIIGVTSRPHRCAR